MFPDSEIATKMQLKHAKIGYTLVHRIAPVFKRDLLKELEACSYISFDESLNKISQKQQMDLNVRFWDEEKKEVICRYLNSVFLGHSTALDLQNAFISGLMEVDLKKIIQVAMDGPNVNLKFLNNLRQELPSSPVDPILLDMGSCGLHTLNCAFKAGMKATNWNLVEYLRALYNLFKDVPARRADYLQCTGSSIFAKKFCSIRWVENADVAQRALEILPNMKKYISYVNEQKQPKCKSFDIVAEHVHDPLIGAKLAFYQTLAEISEPFLKEFQENSALAPFLYESLSLLSLSVSTRFIKNDILDKFPLNKVDFSDSSIMKPSHGIDLGFAVRDVLKKTKKISDQSLLLFQQDCRKAFKIFIKKIMERSPLKYPLTKAISFLDPLVFVKEKISNSRLKLCLQILVSNNWLSGISADRIHQEFQHLHKNNEVNDIMKSYNKNEKRLDHHWINILEICKCSNELQNLVKFLCILSHGNAALERGFFVNKECIVENQSELSLIALRRIHDTILAAGGIEKIKINKKLIQAAQNARSYYNEYLKQECSLERKRKDLSINKKKVQELQIKKMKLLSDTKEKITSIDEEIIQLKK